MVLLPYRRFKMIKNPLDREFYKTQLTYQIEQKFLEDSLFSELMFDSIDEQFTQELAQKQLKFVELYFD